MEKIPTAEEFLNNYRFKAGEHIGNSDLDMIAKYAKDFAKLHVAAALEAARENANFKSINSREEYLPEGTDRLKVINEEMPDDPKAPWYCTYIDKDSILTAYPLENIK